MSTPRLSVIVIGYNMARELPRTVRSLSPALQRDISADDYEIIVIDNGSTQDFELEQLQRLGDNIRTHRMLDATPSPVPAINHGLALARGGLIGVLIDGARMASPGLIRACANAANPSLIARTGEGEGAEQDSTLISASRWAKSSRRGGVREALSTTTIS